MPVIAPAWYCCYCGDGPKNEKLEELCLSCGHQFCPYCSKPQVWIRQPVLKTDKPGTNLTSDWDIQSETVEVSKNFAAKDDTFKLPFRDAGLPEEVRSVLNYPQVEQMTKSSQLEFFENDIVSFIDWLKIGIETFSGEPWVWWPLNEPFYRIEDGYQRVRWRCACGWKESVDIPNTSVGPLYRLVSELRQRPPDGGNQSQPGPGNGPPLLTSWAPGSWSQFCPHHGQLSSVSESSGIYWGTSFTVSESPFELLSNQSGVGQALFILLCTFRGDRLRFGQVDVKKNTDDNDFIEALLREYRCMIGELRYWLDPRVLAFCSHAKFTRDVDNHLSKHREPQLPLGEDYHFVKKPLKGDPYNPPISEHEWYDHFYGNARYPDKCRCVLAQIPKRDWEFGFSTHSGREDMYGLLAERRPSFFRVVVWTLVILSAGIAFLIWWLAQHWGDWQNAIAPITITFMAIAYLWMPLSEHFNQKF